MDTLNQFKAISNANVNITYTKVIPHLSDNYLLPVKPMHWNIYN